MPLHTISAYHLPSHPHPRHLIPIPVSISKAHPLRECEDIFSFTSSSWFRSSFRPWFHLAHTIASDDEELTFEIEVSHQKVDVICGTRCAKISKLVSCDARASQSPDDVVSGGLLCISLFSHKSVYVCVCVCVQCVCV